MKKKEALANFIELLQTELKQFQSINDRGQLDEKIERYKKIIAYLKELQEARETFRRCNRQIAMWDD